MKFKLKAPGTERLKLKYGNLLSRFAFKINLRRYISEHIDIIRGAVMIAYPMVGWCRLTL